MPPTWANVPRGDGPGARPSDSTQLTSDAVPAQASSSSGPSHSSKHNASHPRQSYCLPLPLPKSLSMPVKSDPGGTEGSRANGLMAEPSERGSLSIHSHVGSNAAAESLSKVIACICRDAGFDGANASAAATLQHLTQEFILRLGLIAIESHAIPSGRVKPTSHDLMDALGYQGTSVLDLRGYVRARRVRMDATSEEVLKPENVSEQMKIKSKKARGKERAKDDELPSWATLPSGFLAPVGPLVPAAHVANNTEEDDLNDVHAVSTLQGMLNDAGTSHLPRLPPRYTFVHTPVYSKSDSLPSVVTGGTNTSGPLAPEHSTSRTSDPTATGSVKSLESVERKWTHSQLTQSSLKSLIKRVDAAQAGLYDAVAEAVQAEALERQALREEQRAAATRAELAEGSAHQRQGSTSFEESLPRRAKRERTDSEAVPLGATEKKRAKIILSKNREVSPHSSSGSGTPNAMSPPRHGTPDAIAAPGPSSMGPPPTTSITAAAGPGPPRRSISLSLKREGRPTLSVVPTPPMASPGGAGASSNASASPASQGLSTIRTGSKISLKLRTSSAATAAPSGADSSSALGSRVTSQPASSVPLTPRTPLAALYSPGAAKLGLGIGMGLPPRSRSGSISGPSGGDGYFSRIHSALSRRSTVSSGLDTSGQFADLSGASRTGSLAFPGASSRTVSGDSFGNVPATPATPFTPSAYASMAYAYPPTPVEAHHPMGGSTWRASIFVGAREGGSPFSFPPPSPLPSDVVEGIGSRAASVSTPAPAEPAAQPGSATSQPEGQQHAAALLEDLSSLPGVVNYKNAFARRVKPVA